jgi:tetratricopeptide (TPR) repeat protein
LPDPYIDLAATCAVQRKFPESLENALHAIRLDPASAQAWYHAANALFYQGKLAEAIDRYHQALHLAGIAQASPPANSSTVPVRETSPSALLALIQNGLGTALLQQGRTADGIAAYRQAVKLAPDYLEALNNLAWILATRRDAAFRNGSEAAALAQSVCAADPSTPGYFDTLAAAFGATGNFEKAVAAEEKAIGLAQKASQPDAANRYRSRLELYQKRQPYVETEPVTP